MQEDPTISSNYYAADSDVKELFYLFENAPFSMSVLKGSSLIIEMSNNKLLEIWGKKKEDVIGKPLFECFPELIGTESEKIFRTAIETGEKFVAKEYESSFLRNGKLHHAFFDLNIDPIIQSDGSVTGLLATSTEVTEQVLARRKIEESEEQLHLITDALPALVAYINKEEQYQFNNKGYELWFGHSTEKIKGKTIREVTGEKAYARLAPFIKKVLTGQTVSYETWVPYKDGGEKYISATYIPHFNEENKVAGFYALVNDLTERKKTEHALLQSEEINRLFIKYAPAAMAMFDKEMKYISVSNQWMKDYDLEGDIIGKKHYDLFPNILDRWKEVHSRCMKGAVEKAEADYYVKDNGSSVWLKWEVHPWYKSSDEIGGIVIFTENITERKKTQQLIKESEERFRMLATEAPIFVWLTDEKLQTTYLNKAGLEYFNIGESMGMSTLSWKKFIHPDDLPGVLDTMNKAAKKHESYTIEMRLKNGKTGDYHWFLDKGQPRYENDKFIGFIGTSLDIHQKREAEENEYKKQKEELEKAIESDKLKSDFIKMASHELKTPITSIKGFVQLLLTMLNESKQKELSPLMVKSSLVSIERQVNRLTRLMSELLDLSRLESGQFELSTEVHSLNELMIDIIQDVLYTYPKQRLNLYHEFECKILCDKDRLSQAVMNLLINAIKYSPGADKVDVTISKYKDNTVAVSIQDYGIGIDKNDHGRIFERFYRVEGKTELTYQGFGIGLYIAKEIIQMHGGDIKVKSDKGKGSVFTFTLPITK